MSRPQENRIVYALPLFSKFKPLGINGQDQIQLQHDEFKAFHLADHIGLSHATAAGIMKISYSSFTRLIEKARKKIADFLIQGKLLTIDGGSIHFRNNIIRRKSYGHMIKTNFSSTITVYPICHSRNLINPAGSFRHGTYCNFRHINKRR